jgi:uncharacterized coiled-coil protein SlyX
MEISLSL